MPVDAFDNHLKIRFVEERLCRLPKNTDEIFPTFFCADAPPLLQVPHRPGLRAFHSMLTEKHKGHREAARIGTGELPSSNGEAQTHGACLALRPAPRHRHMRARCLLYACRIPRSAVPPSRRAPHRTTLPEKKASASLPSRIRTGSLGQTSPVLPKSVPHKGLSCQTASISSPKMKI